MLTSCGVMTLLSTRSNTKRERAIDSVIRETPCFIRKRAVCAGTTKAPAGQVCNKGCFRVTVLLATDRISAASVLRLSVPMTSRPSATYSRCVVATWITVLPAATRVGRWDLSGQIGSA